LKLYQFLLELSDLKATHGALPIPLPLPKFNIMPIENFALFFLALSANFILNINISIKLAFSPRARKCAKIRPKNGPKMGQK